MVIIHRYLGYKESDNATKNVLGQPGITLPTLIKLRYFASVLLRPCCHIYALQHREEVNELHEMDFMISITILFS